MAQHNLSKIVDDNGDEYLIKAKGLESQVQISLTGDVTGSATTDFSSDPSISTTIGNGKVTESKLATDSVTNAKIKDGEITKAKFNASVYDETAGSIADGTNSNLATKTQVKAYVESVVSSEGHYKGVQSVTTINSWTAANLHNGDRVITSSDPAGSGTGTLTLGNLPVVDGQEVIFFVSDDQSTKIWQSSEGNYKIKQSAVSDPTASGTTITAIDTISQNANGEISATKKTIRGATTSQTGVVQLAGSIGATVSSENNKAASEKAVRDAINALDSDATSTNGTNVQVKVVIKDGNVNAVNITKDTTENKNNKVTAWSATTTDTHYPSEKLVKTSLDGKADKVSSATAGNFAGLDANGNLTDSGSKASDFATSAQGTKADSAIQGVKLNGASSALTPDSNKVVTIPDAIATGTTGETNGLMTAADKQKLDGIATGAEVNQNAFSNVKVGSTTVQADSKTDTLELVAGGAVTITPDATNDKITISSTDQSVTAVGNHYAPTEDSTAEKDASGGSATQLPTSSTGTLVQVVTGVKMDAKGHVTGVKSKGLWSPNNIYTNASLAQGYGTCATAEATATKAVTLSNYELKTGGIVAVKFMYGLCAGAALNINSTGAKKIFIDGAAVTAATATRVLAGDIASFIFDGSNYQFLGTDHAERKFDINYRASDNALVFTKKFGTAS